jgi:hypothetical protein
LIQIDGLTTNDGAATLNLKQLNLVNPDAQGLYVQSGIGWMAAQFAAGDGAVLNLADSALSTGAGISAIGIGTGSGIKSVGGATGHGMLLQGGASGGDGFKVDANFGYGIEVRSPAGAAVVMSSTGGPGLQIEGALNNSAVQISTSGDADGMTVLGSGSGVGIRSVGGDTGHGMLLQGGATSGDGLWAEGQGHGHGIKAEGVATK